MSFLLEKLYVICWQTPLPILGVRVCLVFEVKLNGVWLSQNGDSLIELRKLNSGKYKRDKIKVNWTSIRSNYLCYSN